MVIRLPAFSFCVQRNCLYNAGVPFIKNFGIIQTNSQGIIDESYNGPDDQWFFPAYALRATVINVNDRICQFRILEHQPQIEFIENTLTDNIDRGGHGSTGIR